MKKSLIFTECYKLVWLEGQEPNIIFLNGPGNVARIWKYKKGILDLGVQTSCLTRVFRILIEAVNMFTLDTSGILRKLKPGSNIAPRNRTDYLIHANLHQLAD